MFDGGADSAFCNGLFAISSFVFPSNSLSDGINGLDFAFNGLVSNNPSYAFNGLSDDFAHADGLSNGLAYASGLDDDPHGLDV